MSHYKISGEEEYPVPSEGEQDIKKIEKLLNDTSHSLDPLERLQLEFTYNASQGLHVQAVDNLLEHHAQGGTLFPTIDALPWVLDELLRRQQFLYSLSLVNVALEKGFGGWQLKAQHVRCLVLTRQPRKALLVLRSFWGDIPKGQRASFGVLEARILLLLGKPNQALTKFTTHVEAGGQARPAFDRATVLAIRLKKWDLAHRFSQRAIRVLGPNPDRCIRSAKVALEIEKYQLALTNSTQALQILKKANLVDLKKQRICWEIQADARMGLSRYSGAMKNLLIQSEQDPKWKQGSLLLAECCVYLDRPDEAQKILSSLIEVWPTHPDVLFMQYKISRMLNDDSVADETLKTLTEYHPNHIKTLELVSNLNDKPLKAIEHESLYTGSSEKFYPQWDKDIEIEGASFFKGYSLHLRSVTALFIRESRTRFVRYKLGILWALLEPAVSIALLLLIFSVIGRNTFYDLSLPVFIVTGLIPFQLFSSCFSRMSSAVSGNKDLFLHPRVQVIDVIAARVILEILTIILVFVGALLTISYFMEPPQVGDMLMIMAGFLGLLSCGVGLGLITGSIQIVFPAVATLIQHSTRLLFFTSGVFFAPEMFTSTIRDYIMYNPLLHYISMIRNSFSPILGYENVDLLYAFFWGVLLLTIGFSFERVFRFRLLSN